MTSKNVKRIISFILVFVLAFSVSVFAYAENDETADNVVYENEEDIPVLHSDPDDFVLDDNWKPYDPDLFENDMPNRDETWIKKGSLKTVTNGDDSWRAQGFAVGTGYCYSIDCKLDETAHKLYRKNMNNNSDAELMTQSGSVDSLLTANDMTLATYTESNGTVHRYLYVMVASQASAVNSYIIKLEYDGLTYWQVARYNLSGKFYGIAKVKYYTNLLNVPMIQFLLRDNGSGFYTVAIQRAQTGTYSLTPTHRFDITIPQDYTNYKLEGIHYDSGKLYCAFFGYKTKIVNNEVVILSNHPKENAILVYDNADTAISSIFVNTLTTNTNNIFVIQANTSDIVLFEIEGIGFPVNNPNLDCDRLWFTTNERTSAPSHDLIDGGIYADTQNIR